MMTFFTIIGMHYQMLLQFGRPGWLPVIPEDGIGVSIDDVRTFLGFLTPFICVLLA